MSNDPKHGPTYTKEEVASILSRALDAQHEGGRLSHDELLETAREIGMTTLEIEAAVAEEVRQRAARMQHEEEQRKARDKFLRHLGVFGVTSLAFVLADVLLTHGVWWYYAVLAWGVGVAVHGVHTFLRRGAPPPPLPAPARARIEVRGGRVALRAGDPAPDLDAADLPAPPPRPRA